MEAEEQVAHVTGTLTRADVPRPRTTWMKLIEEEELDLGMDLRGPVLNTSRY
jgi:hypothetical protein